MEQIPENKQQNKRAYWRQHIEGWRQSGLSQQDYCQSNDIALATFGYWRRKLKKSEADKPRFYPLIVSAQAPSETTACTTHSSLRLVLDGNRFAIEIGEQFSPPVLQRLVTTLEQL